MEVLLVGLNHRTAPIAVRERLAFSEDEVRAVLPLLRERTGSREALVLSTCNRVEALVVHPGKSANGNLSGKRVMDTLMEWRGSGRSIGPEHLYEYRDVDAVRHLFRVAAGLDSMVLGEPQVLGQIKEAYGLAVEAGCNGRYVNRILHLAFRAGKRVRTETEISYGGVSVASVAVSLASKVFGDFSRCTGLVIGAGEMAETAARNLREQGIQKLLFVNRSLDKAERLALELDGEAMSFDRLFEALELSDVVISSTGAPGLILTHEKFHEVMDKRHVRPVFLIDIAVPRDVDPEINDHDNAFVYDIDGIQNVADLNLSRRLEALPGAEAVVEQEVGSFVQWLEGLRIEPIVKEVYEHFDSLRRQEIHKNLKRFCDHEANDLEKLTCGIQKKILHRPTEILRQCDPETEEGRRTMELIRDLFGLK